jgi:hypothetical protein
MKTQKNVFLAKLLLCCLAMGLILLPRIVQAEAPKPFGFTLGVTTLKDVRKAGYSLKKDDELFKKYGVEIVDYKSGKEIFINQREGNYYEKNNLADMWQGKGEGGGAIFGFNKNGKLFYVETYGFCPGGNCPKWAHSKFRYLGEWGDDYFQAEDGILVKAGRTLTYILGSTYWELLQHRATAVQYYKDLEARKEREEKQRQEQRQKKGLGL